MKGKYKMADQNYEMEIVELEQADEKRNAFCQAADLELTLRGGGLGDVLII